MEERRKVQYKGELDLDGIKIPCYVLEDGTRVLSGRGMQEALKMVDDNRTTSGHRIIRYLNQKTLKPFIYKGKTPVHFNPIICYDGNFQKMMMCQIGQLEIPFDFDDKGHTQEK